MKVIAAAVLLVVLFVSSQRHSSAQTAACMEPDAVTDLLVREFRGMMTASDSALRSGLHLPVVDTTEITVVQTDSVCVRARLALEVEIRKSNPAAIPLGERAVYVIAIRDHFAVALPGNNSSETDVVDVFSPSWVWLGKMVH